jgi:hypothetical protein
VYTQVVRLRRVASLFILGAPASTALVSAASCTSFGGDDAAQGVDANDDRDTARSDADPADAADARNETGADAGLRPPCPPPAGGTTLPTTWDKRTLYSPAGRMYPFAIATDATHVTWVAQPGVTDGGDDTEPYNGNASAVILRVSKLGNAPPVVLARDQPRVKALVLEGDSVYWTTFANGIPTLVRLPRDADCAAGCATPEVVAPLSGGYPVSRLVRAAPGILFGMGDTGKLFRIELGSLPTVVIETGAYPAMTATATHVFAAGLESARVQRSTLGRPPMVDDPYLDIPEGGPVGVGPIATDCTSLWMVRGTELLRHELAVTPRTLTPFADFGTGLFDLATDAKYVYGGAPNAAGVFVIDRVSSGLSQLYAGNVFGLAVDDDGVYFGEHGGAGAGTITMLVKK